MVCTWRNFQKKSHGISKYDKWNFKPQILFIFQFDQGSDGWMAHVLGVKCNAESLKVYEIGELMILSTQCILPFVLSFQLVFPPEKWPNISNYERGKALDKLTLFRGESLKNALSFNLFRISIFFLLFFIQAQRAIAHKPCAR